MEAGEDYPAFADGALRNGWRTVRINIGARSLELSGTDVPREQLASAAANKT